MTGFQAAMGLVQLSRFDEVLRRKRQLADWYREKLEGVPGLPYFPAVRKADTFIGFTESCSILAWIAIR